MNIHAVGGPQAVPAPQPLHTTGVSAHNRAATPAPPATPSPVALPVDSVASFLASGKIADLIAGIDQRRPVQSPEVVAELLREAVSAAEVQDFVRALEKARELVAMDPERAETLASEPAFQSLNAELSQLLRELTAAARSDAEQKLNTAHEALASDGSQLPEPDQADLHTLLSVAVQLFDTGQHANYVKAGDLAEVVTDVMMVQCGWTPAGVPVWIPVEAPTVTRAAGRWENLWRRTPLPILVLAWLALGLAAALPFVTIHAGWPVAAFALCLWGAGLAALVRFYRLARRRWEKERSFQAAATQRAT